MTLTADQMHDVLMAARLLPPAQRPSFERSVAGRLSAIATPTDIDVAHAVSFVLGCRGVAVGHSRHKEKPHAFR
jgi:hypothetical protein